MDCARCEALVDAYVDDELSVETMLAIEDAAVRCPDCRRRIDEARVLRAALRATPDAGAPAGLRDVIVAALPRSAAIALGAARVPTLPRAGVLARRDWMRLAAAIAVSLGAGWVAGRYLDWPGDGGDSDALVAGYLRVLGAERPVEVASSDRHAVRPWFGGKIDFAPPVHDLTTDGFPLLGGRVDVLEGRRVAVLVYRRNSHLIALFVRPRTRPSARHQAMRDGFALLRWSASSFVFDAVADIAPRELERLAAALEARLASER